MVTYDVQVQRGDRWWVLRVPAVRAAVSQAKSLRDVESSARDLIAVLLEVPADSFELAVRVELPAPVQKHIRRAEELRESAGRSQSDAAREIRAAAAEMKQAGMTLRDIGAALGVSYQRAHQLVTEAA